jgi:hypothetical protein
MVKSRMLRVVPVLFLLSVSIDEFMPISDSHVLQHYSAG